MRPFFSHRPRHLALALTAFVSFPVAAVDITSSFNVTATVVATCSISASTLAFGSYSSSQLDGTSSLSVACTNGAPYVIALDAGTGSGATVTTRRMTNTLNSAQSLGYSLYRDASRSLVWGSSLGVNMAAGVGSGSTQTITVYGRISASQYPEAGSYSDTVIATLTY